MSKNFSARTRSVFYCLIASILLILSQQPRGCFCSIRSFSQTPLGGVGWLQIDEEVAKIDEVATGTLLTYRAALYSHTDAPAVEPPGDGQSFFRIGLTQVKFNEHRRGSKDLDDRAGLHLLILHSSELHRGKYGATDKTTNTLHWCCTSRLLPLGLDGCTESWQVGRLIVSGASTRHENNDDSRGIDDVDNSSNSSNRDNVHREGIATVNLENAAHGKDSASSDYWYFPPSKNHGHAIRQTGELSGYYHGFVIDCFGQELLTGEERTNYEPDNQPVIVSGKMEWMNPFGHLSGNVYPLYPFYGVMSFASILLAIFWFVSSFRNWENLLPLQSWITSLLAMGMFESMLWYFDYHTENLGNYQLSITLFALASSAAKLALARLVFALIASGHGLNQPLLNADGLRIISLCAVFCLVATAKAVSDLYASRFHDDTARYLSRFCALPLTIIDAIIFWWLFQAGTQTLTALKKPHFYYKLKIFRSFVYTLTISTLISSCALGYELWLSISGSEDDSWSYAWLSEASSFLVIFATTTVIALLFSPASSFFLTKSETTDHNDILNLAPTVISFAPHHTDTLPSLRKFR